MRPALHPSHKGPSVPEVYLPADLDDAVAFLAENAPRAVPVAGGTNLLVDQRVGRVAPEWLVDVSRLEPLRGLSVAGDRVTIGALTTIREIELSAELAARATAIVEAARLHGSIQTRGMATVGGNLANATPSAEMYPPLLLHDAEVTVAGSDDERSIPLRALPAGPNQTTLRPGEVILRVTAALGRWGSCYLSQTARWAMDLSGASVAAALVADGGRVAEARIALGAVGPVPQRVPTAEAVLAGAAIEEAADEAGRLAAAASTPISDARGSADYRRAVVAALVPRALRIAWLRATGSWPDGAFAPPNGVVP